MGCYSFVSRSISKIAEIYNLKDKSLHPYEYFKDKQLCYILLGNLTREDFKSSLAIKLPSQEVVDNFKKN